MHLFVGLGNPGSEYGNTRHNIGFMAVDAFIHRFSFSSPKLKFQAEICEGTIDGQKVFAVKPMTFMNLSGKAVREVLQFYKIPISQVTVFHDDLDLAPGKIRIKVGGGAGGHNGLKSLDSHITPLYRRVRLGIGHPGEAHLVSPYVLGKFSSQELTSVNEQLGYIAELCPLLLKGDEPSFLNKYALLQQGKAI